MTQNAASIETNLVTSRWKGYLLFPGALLILITGGIGTGLIVAFVGSFFYLAFLFPLAMGYAGGSILKSAIQAVKTRKQSHLIVFSLLVAILMYGTYHYGRFEALQLRMAFEMSSGFSEAMSDKGLELGKSVLDYALQLETGHTGFVGYMLYKAQEGVSLGRLVSSSNINLGPVLTWIYWLMEIGIILGITVTMGRNELLVPVCDACGSRYGSDKHLGGTSMNNKSVLLELINRKDFAEAGKLLQENTDLPSLELYLKSCPSCDKGISHLTVQQAAQGPKGSVIFTDVSKVTLQPQDRLALSQ